MKRKLSDDFFKTLHAKRDELGEKEYDRDEELLPFTKKLLVEKANLDGDELLTRYALDLLDDLDRSDAKSGDMLFDFGQTVILGNKKRIKRKAMTREHLLRRRGVIDDNKVVQDSAWARESKWLRGYIDALATAPSGMTIEEWEKANAPEPVEPESEPVA